jgi:hypothetical protein
MRVAKSPTENGDTRSGLFVPDSRQAVSKFLEAGLTLLESLSSPTGADGFCPIESGHATFLRTDAQTGRPTLEILLPESVTGERLARVITGFLTKDQTALIRECAQYGVILWPPPRHGLAGRDCAHDLGTPGHSPRDYSVRGTF